MALWTVVTVTVLLLVWGIAAFNRFVRLKNEIENAWHQIDVQLKRRADLVPNLVSVVRGYMDYERGTLESVVRARSLTLSAQGLRERAEKEDGLSRSLSGLYAVIERYPDLKSNEQVLQLQEELTSTENRIAFSRHHFNDLVANYRVRLAAFPDMVIGALFSFQPAEFFSAEPPERIVPKAALRRD